MIKMSEDTQAVLLLCGHFGRRCTVEPLHLRDYNRVVQWLVAQKRRPEDLVRLECVPGLAHDTGLSEERLNALLKRGLQLALAVEKWDQSGIWVISRGDPDYPVRFRNHLKEQAPSLLFGTGNRALLAGGGLAIVGSRKVDAPGETCAREVAAWCSRSGFTVVSGGARGVDQAAMSTALAAGGVGVEVVADTLLKRSVAQEARSALAAGRLLLISPHPPEAGFNLGNAMERNKLIYALADYGLVVSAEQDKGGTWAGACEELQRRRARPVFVRLTETVLPGNRKLAARGAIAFPPFTVDDAPAAVLSAAASSRPNPEAQTQEIASLPLFKRPH